MEAIFSGIFFFLYLNDNMLSINYWVICSFLSNFWGFGILYYFLVSQVKIFFFPLVDELNVLHRGPHNSFIVSEV